MCQRVETIVRMIDGHNVKTNFLKAPAEHGCSCTNFDNQRFERWRGVFWWLFRWLSLWQLWQPIMLFGNFYFRRCIELWNEFII